MANRVLAVLGIFAALVLGGAAVWMGALNQDEGWYLYAANLVAEGQIPYADFAYTQGPVLPIVYSFFAGIWRTCGLLGARIFTLALGFAGILFAALTARRLAVAASMPADAASMPADAAPMPADAAPMPADAASMPADAAPMPAAAAPMLADAARSKKGRSRDEVGAKSVESASNAASTTAALVVFLLLGNNLYHLYYLAIPKTYALATLFVMLGFYLLTFVRDERTPVRIGAAVLSGASLALAAGTRISLGVIPAVVGVGLVVECVLARRRGGAEGASDEGCLARRRGGAEVCSHGCGVLAAVSRWPFLWFGLGGGAVLALVYGSLLLCPATREGLLAAQKYHAARGGFDIVFAVGSLSRLVRWYLPIFILLGLSVAFGAASRRDGKGQAIHCPPTFSTRFLPRSLFLLIILLSFLAVFAVQMLAPFPYEDYQVPIMALLAIYAAVNLTIHCPPTFSTNFLLPILTLGLTWACSFGSPLLEKWTTNGQDRFWTLKKEKTELAQLRDVAQRIRELDPEGKDIFTQDTYLAVETNRKVPAGLEMGPFSVLTDEAWRKLLASAPCRVAAFSGYGFAVRPPVCDERPLKDQLDYWSILRERYDLAFQEEAFGQNSTTLLVLERKSASEK